MKIQKLALLAILITTSVAMADKLLFATEIIRHGERTPIIDLPNMPQTGLQDPGQLTEHGIMQEYNLVKRI